MKTFLSYKLEIACQSNRIVNMILMEVRYFKTIKITNFRYKFDCAYGVLSIFYYAINDSQLIIK